MTELDAKLKTARRSFRTKIALGSFAGMVFAALTITIIFFTHGISFRITPPDAADNATVSIADGTGFALLDSVYLLGARAKLSVTASGFISREVTVNAAESTAPLLIEMREAPARVTVATSPALPNTRWYVDGAYTETAAQFEFEFPPAAIEIKIDNAFYQTQTLNISAKRGEQLTRNVVLPPITGEIQVASEPSGATVLLNENARGSTPMTLAQLAGGEHELHITLDGYEAVTESVTVTNTESTIARDYRLKRKQVSAHIRVSPAGGVLRVNGATVKLTDALPLTAGVKQIIRYEKAGYVAQTREVNLAANERADLSFALVEELGKVIIRSQPRAAIFINGKARGETPVTLSLRTAKQNIKLSRDGFRSAILTVKPSATDALLINETLRTEFAARLVEAKSTITAGDVTLKFFDPRGRSGEFKMGAANSDKARRANEFQRDIKLTKPFYIGVTEITEAQFAKFKSSSPASKLPARNVSWRDAAAFCNWLSAQENLQPAYQFSGAQTRFNPTADGYRLPLEAEWEWLARVTARPASVRFVWGDETAVPSGSGNFADESAVGTLAKYIPRYKDGFADVAPVASFVADAAGLYDMAGNVSEWVHDRYDLRPPRAGLEINPVGASDADGVSGDARVVKGASFRTASVTGLRASFREGLSRGRDDLGFRVARYLYGAE